MGAHFVLLVVVQVVLGANPLVTQMPLTWIGTNAVSQAWFFFPSFVSFSHSSKIVPVPGHVNRATSIALTTAITNSTQPNQLLVRTIWDVASLRLARGADGKRRASMAGLLGYRTGWKGFSSPFLAKAPQSKV